MRAYLRVVHDVREESAIARSGIPRRAVGAGAPSGLQNRRETSRSPVRSIRTALRQNSQDTGWTTASCLRPATHCLISSVPFMVHCICE